MKERLTAIRASIADIMDGEYGEDDGPRVISPQGVELRRVLLVGTIVDQVASTNNYASITLDDGTATIRAKSWGAEAEMLQKVSPNILALVVGKVREYDDEVYIVPEIVREIDDPNVLTLHSYERQLAILRLANRSPASPSKEKSRGPLMSFDTSSKPPQEKKTGATDVKGLAGEILEYIRKSDKGKGISTDEIVQYFEGRGIDPVKVNLMLIDLMDAERIIEQEIGVYRYSS
jgi:RPA family protein